MENDQFYKVVMTHAETLDPEIVGAIACGEMPKPERLICRATYHWSREGAEQEVDGILKDPWFKDADIKTGAMTWHCSKLRTKEMHTPGGQIYIISQVVYKEIRIEAYTIRA